MLCKREAAWTHLEAPLELRELHYPCNCTPFECSKSGVYPAMKGGRSYVRCMCDFDLNRWHSRLAFEFDH